MNINFLNKIKLLLGITYEDPIKDEEIKILIESAKLFLLNAGWHKRNIENAQSVIAIVVYIKMAQNIDIINFINHPVITNLIMQNQAEQSEVEISLNSDNLNLDKIEKDIQKINNSLNLILNKIEDEIIIEKIEEIKGIINTNDLSGTELMDKIQNSIDILQEFNEDELKVLIINLQTFITNFLLDKNEELKEKLEVVLEGIQTINNTIANLTFTGTPSVKLIRQYEFNGLLLDNSKTEVGEIITFNPPIELMKTQVICNCYTIRDNKIQNSLDSLPYEMPQPVTYKLTENSINIIQNPLAKIEVTNFTIKTNSYLYGNLQIIEYN